MGPLIHAKVKPDRRERLTFFRQVALVNTPVYMYGKPCEGKSLSALKRKAHN